MPKDKDLEERAEYAKKGTDAIAKENSVPGAKDVAKVRDKSRKALEELDNQLIIQPERELHGL